MTTKLRLFLLPISTRRTLIYCEHRTPPADLANGQKPPIQERIIARAATTWSGWERAEKGWQKQLTVYGNKILKRIPYQEWGLKSIPPGTQSRIKDWTEGSETAHHSKRVIECLYPKSFLKGDVAETLRTIATERQPFHRRRVWNCIALMPVAAPFAIVPVIPNIPFFYLVFRAYSHWRAWYGGKFLEHLVAQPGLIQPKTCAKLEEVCAAGVLKKNVEKGQSFPAITEKEVEEVKTEMESRADEEVMLLSSWSGRVLAEEYEVPEMQVEIERAVDQVEAIIAKAKEEAAQASEKAAAAEEAKDSADVKAEEVKKS